MSTTVGKDDLILAQVELIATQTDVINKQAVGIGQLKQQVAALVDSVNWYESETRHNETFERLRGELEAVQAENKLLRGEIDVLATRIHTGIRG
jgi:hypothetical protein